MKNLLLLLLIFVISGGIYGCADRISKKTASPAPAPMASFETMGDRAPSDDEEGAVQEPAWTYYERLSYLFGADSTCVGISSDMVFPEWYSGCFVNNRDRLTINVVGDTTKLRKMLTDKLGGNEFDIGVGLYSKSQQQAVDSLLKKAMEESDSPVARPLMWGWEEDGTIGVTVQGVDDSVIDRFKRDVFDSPLLRFSRSEKVGIIVEREEIEVQEKPVDGIRVKNDFKDTESDAETGKGVFECYIEQSPIFPGGDAALLEYIQNVMTYPREAYGENIQGRVILQLLINERGDIDTVKVVRSKDRYLDAEALRIAKTLPRFTPGRDGHGNVQKMWYTLPINFNIADYDARHAKRYSPFIFDNGPDPISDGMMRVVDKDGKIGYADSLGNTVITPRFACAYPFKDGRAKVADWGSIIYEGEHYRWVSDSWYHIDKAGRKVD